MSVASGGMSASVQYSPAQLARLLRLPEPTQEQSAVIGAPLGPMAVIAGAGSGKSETMAARLVWLVANGMVRPDRVLGLTFTRKAAAELADRFGPASTGCVVSGLSPPARHAQTRRAASGRTEIRRTILRRALHWATAIRLTTSRPVVRGPGHRDLPRLRGAAGQRPRPAGRPRAVAAPDYPGRVLADGGLNRGRL